MLGSWHLAAVSLALAATPAEIAVVGDGGIFASHADGSGRTLLVAPAKGETIGNPVWSPDGQTLAYITGGEEDGRIIVGTRELTPKRANITESGLTWSPDGTKLAFSRVITGENTFDSQIVVRTIASGAEQVLLTQKIDNRLSAILSPSWSPDGATIAYTLFRYDRRADGAPQIRTIPAAGGASKLLINKAQLPAYAPDGRIAYASIRDRNGHRCGSDECVWAGELYVANGDGSNAKRLTKDEGEIGSIAWAPDSSRLLFSSDRSLPEGASTELYSIAPDGGCFTWLTNGTPGTGDATFRPGSGDSFAPPNCDPDTRKGIATTPSIKRYTGNLWAGPKTTGLVLSSSDHNILGYHDCERFNGCPTDFWLSPGRTCGEWSVFRGDRLAVRRGRLVLFQAFESRTIVFGGRSATYVQPQRNITLKRAREIVDALKPIRRETPRIPRSVLNQLDAEQKAELRPYRVCGRA